MITTDNTCCQEGIAKNLHKHKFIRGKGLSVGWTDFPSKPQFPMWMLTSLELTTQQGVAFNTS